LNVLGLGLAHSDVPAKRNSAGQSAKEETGDSSFSGSGSGSGSDLRSYSSSIKPEGWDISDMHIPRLDLTHNSNYIVWMQCRTILHNFGHRYRFRLDIYNGNVNNSVTNSVVLFL
jgi:hypothetical protein